MAWAAGSCHLCRCLMECVHGPIAQPQAPRHRDHGLGSFPVSFPWPPDLSGQTLPVGWQSRWGRDAVGAREEWSRESWGCWWAAWVAGGAHPQQWIIRAVSGAPSQCGLGGPGLSMGWEQRPRPDWPRHIRFSFFFFRFNPFSFVGIIYMLQPIIPVNFLCFQ